MIQIENVRTEGWDAALRGMRNPMNSWDKSDSSYVFDGADEDGSLMLHYEMGPNDLKLATQLVKAGTDHAKFARMITVTADITAPRYWWIEESTYRVGAEVNSTSTMHKIMSKPFELSDFSVDVLDRVDEYYETSTSSMQSVVDRLNFLRDMYLGEQDLERKKIWWRATIQSLPQSYNQRRTVMVNYQVLRNMYFARRNHKLSEWHEFCAWIETLPYAAELITVEAGQ